MKDDVFYKEPLIRGKRDEIEINMLGYYLIFLYLLDIEDNVKNVYFCWIKVYLRIHVRIMVNLIKKKLIIDNYLKDLAILCDFVYFCFIYSQIYYYIFKFNK